MVLVTLEFPGWVQTRSRFAVSTIAKSTAAAINPNDGPGPESIPRYRLGIVAANAPAPGGNSAHERRRHRSELAKAEPKMLT
jgi:hypothetical protein